jgi:hypothetical protein
LAGALIDLPLLRMAKKLSNRQQSMLEFKVYQQALRYDIHSYV